MKKSIVFLAPFFIGFFVAEEVLAYKPLTHQEITEVAYGESTIPNINLARRFGIGSNVVFRKTRPVDSELEGGKLEFVTGSEGEASILELLRHGADQEDEGTRPLRHFLDPQNGNRGIPFNANSATWAIEDIDYGNVSTFQKLSYRDAVNFYRAGITGQSQTVRVANLSRMFQALGHTVHHIQDMAQPQHVRSDMHCDADKGPFLKNCKQIEDTLGIPIYEPSNYEIMSRDELNQARIELLYQQSPYATGVDFHSKGFRTVRDFWLKGNVGMAKFVSQNFVSVETNFRGTGNTVPDGSWYDIEYVSHPAFPLPDALQTNLTSIYEASHTYCDEEAEPGTCDLEGKAYYATHNVYDEITNQSKYLNKFSSLSLFDYELKKKGKKLLFTLNNVNYKERHTVLIPRAVAFSVGLFNHFFRGDIALIAGSTPDDFRFKYNLYGSESRSGSAQGQFKLYYDDINGNRKPVSGASWSVSSLSPGYYLDRSFNIPADSSGNYVLLFDGNVDNDPVAMSKHFQMQATEPEPEPACSGPISASGSSNGLDAYYTLDDTAGPVTVEFEAYSIPDRLQVMRQSGSEVFDTQNLVSGYHRETFNHDPSTDGDQIRIKVTGNSNPDTEWVVNVSCPGGEATMLRHKVTLFADCDSGYTNYSCGLELTMDGVTKTYWIETSSLYETLYLTSGGPHEMEGRVVTKCNFSGGSSCDVHETNYPSIQYRLSASGTYIERDRNDTVQFYITNDGKLSTTPE